MESQYIEKDAGPFNAGLLGPVLLVLVVCAAPLHDPLCASALSTADYVIEALRKNDEAALQELIPEMDNLDWIEIEGRTQSLLVEVAKKGMFPLVQLLVEEGADPDEPFRQASVIEYVAGYFIVKSYEFDSAFGEFLLDLGVDPDFFLGSVARNSWSTVMSDRKKIIPHRMTYYLSVMEWAVSHDADVNAEVNGTPVLWYVSGAGAVDLVRFLLDLGADPNVIRYSTSVSGEEKSALEVAPSEEIREMLVEAGAR